MVTAFLALAIGLLVLVGGAAAALRRGPTRHALALFAAAWLPLPIGLFGVAAGDGAALAEIARLGPAVTPVDLARGLESSARSRTWGLLGLALGLTGAAAALARSREETAADA